MAKLVHVQTILEQETLELLKKVSGEHSSKDAVSKAIHHFIACEHRDEEE